MEYYILRLWDCATPSFCSFDKVYVGTEADIRKAIASMKRAGVNEETVAAVSHYLSGDKTATHNIAYKDIPALEECQLLRTSELKIEATEWEHINVWGFPYVATMSTCRMRKRLMYTSRFGLTGTNLSTMFGVSRNLQPRGNTSKSSIATAFTVLR